MKVRPNLPELDPCHTSLGWIRRRVTLALRNVQGAQSVWLPDENPIPPPEEELTDVVLTGAFFIRFLESGNWPARRYRLWTVSTTVREVLIRVLGLPESCIGWIPRDALTSAGPVPNTPRTGNFEWVFAGRISRTKNIEGLLRTVSFLQTEQVIPAPLSLIGNFDALYPGDGGRREVGTAKDYEASIRDLIAQLPWTHAPRILPRAGETDWIPQFRESPVFISLSTYISEDFGVAQAQAAEAGWPSWLSDWGGHRDARADKVHPLWIPRAFDPPRVQALKARLLARRIAEDIRNPRAFLSSPPSEWRVPDTVHTSSLDVCRRAWLRGSGGQGLTLNRHGLEFFADTPYGRSFFGRYRLFFQGSVDALSDSLYDVLLINDLNERPDPECRRARMAAEAAVERALQTDVPLALLAIRDLDLKDVAAAVACARQVHSAVSTPSLPSGLEWSI